MSTDRTRQPAGVPVGGQFAPEHRGRSLVTLDAAADPASADGSVSFADIAREERLEAMRAEIDSAIENLSSPEGWQAFLDQARRFHRYSFNNQMLIAMQRPEATMTAGFNDWKSKHGRRVKKGEKAIWVLAPVTYKTKESTLEGEEQETRRVTGFRAVGVFDVSQTEPIEGDPRGTALDHSGIKIEPLEGEAPEGMVEDLTLAANALGVEVEYSDVMPGGASGYTDFDNNKIVIKASDSDREKASTLAHELGHVACDHRDQREHYHTGRGGKRPDMEVEAESVAYVLGRHYGLDEAGKANFGYIDSWAKGDSAKVKATATTVVKATKSVLDIIENKKRAIAA